MTILTTDKMKEITALTSSVDTDLIQPFIEIAEEFHIKSVLGDSFYNHLLIKIKDDNLNTDERRLVDNYIVPCASFATWYEASIHLYTKTVAKGVVHKYSDNSEVIESDTFKLYRQDIYDKFVMYRNRLLKFLRNNPTMFSEYTDDKRTIKKSNSTGFFLNFK